MPTNRAYDDQFRASAVLMLEAAGYPDRKGALEEVANALHVPDATISRWANGKSNPPPAYVVSEKREELGIRLEELAHKLLDNALRAAGDSEAGIQTLAISLGIILDKRQLLRGAPTAINQSIGDPEQQRLERLSMLMDASKTRQAEKSLPLVPPQALPETSENGTPLTLQ